MIFVSLILVLLKIAAIVSYCKTRNEFKLLEQKLIKNEFKYLYLASSHRNSVFLFKNANDIKTYDFKNDENLNKENLYVCYTKDEIDFTQITDRNYIDSIQIYSHDSQYNKNANRHSVVFMK